MSVKNDNDWIFGFFNDILINFTVPSSSTAYQNLVAWIQAQTVFYGHCKSEETLI